MNRLRRLWGRLPKAVLDRAFDVLVVAVAAVDASLTLIVLPADPLTIGACVLACLALLGRRRWPLVVFALTLPAAVTANILAAPLIALFTLALTTRRRWLLVLCGAVFAAAEVVEWPVVSLPPVSHTMTFVTFVYQLATAAAPLLLGQLLQAASDLRFRIVEIETTRQHEQELYAQNLLARERSQLARRCTMSSPTR